MCRAPVTGSAMKARHSSAVSTAASLGVRRLGISAWFAGRRACLAQKSMLDEQALAGSYLIILSGAQALRRVI